MTKFDNNGRDEENIAIDVATPSDITINVIGTGTEDATTFYLEKGSLGSGYILRPTDQVEIVRIGDRTYRHPIPVSTAGHAITKIKDFSSMVIRTLNANTHIDLEIL